MNQKRIPRGIRNNNPLNIRRNPANKWKGSRKEINDKQFEEFTAPFYGFRAAFILISNYIREGNDTIRKIVTKWAPPNENNTENYINLVNKYTLLDPDYNLKFNDHFRIMSLVGAMAHVECGRPFNPDIIDRAYWSVREERTERKNLTNHD